MKATNCCVKWKTGGIIVGILSLIGSFPVSAKGDVSVSLHFLVVTCCLFYGIYKEKSEFLLPYLVELVVILIQCALSIVKFILLEPYDEESFDSIAYDLFYDRPQHLTLEEKRFILAVFIITSLVIFCFWCIIFSLYRRMRYCKNDDDEDKEDDDTKNNKNNNKINNSTNNDNNNSNDDGVTTVECGKETKIYTSD